ncbi:MAG: glycosyltransferase, partial [Nanoarchaeota archaeon]
RAAKKFNIPVITSNHIQPENLLPSNKLMNIGILKKIIINNLKKFHNLSDVSITPSIFGKNKLLSYGVSNKITILSNGIDRKKFIHSKKGDSLRKKYGFHKDDFIFMSVSRLTPEKNFFILVEALKLISEQRIKLMLLGTGPLERKLRSVILRNRLEDRFVLAGYVDDLPGQYSMPDVYVHPSKIELEGMVVMEAMSCGLPILVSNSEESASRFFVANNGMLFDPDNPIELASRMIEMAGSHKKLKGFSKESIKSAKEHDINKSVSKLEKIYFDYSKK